MHDLSLSSSDQNSSASFECGKLIEQVQKHDLFERNAAQFRYSIYLGNKILVFELMFGKVFNPIIEALGYISFALYSIGASAIQFSEPV